MTKWIGGLAEWDEGETTYLSVAFTWLIPQAVRRAVLAGAWGKRVIAGGPAFLLPSMRAEMEPFAEVPTRTVIDRRSGRPREIPAEHPEGMIVQRHNPLATFASRGCSEDCDFCNVPVLEGDYTFFPDFPVRPILCDNNLSGLPADYQDHIIRRYQETGTPLLDANSGFEPHTFTPEVYARWKPLVNAGKGPWRFALDSMQEFNEAVAVMKMLKAEPAKRKRVYVLIGNEPFDDCMHRIQTVLDHGCEPHVQPKMKQSTLEKRWHIRFDWTEAKLRNVARWANRRGWRYTPFSGYVPNLRSRPRYDATQGLFV